MPCDELPDDLNILWKECEMDRPAFTPNQLRAEADRLRAKRRRNYLVLSVAFSSAVASYVFSFFYFHNTLTRVGSTLSVLVCAYLVVHLMVERARAVPSVGETDGVSFYRSELERRRDWHRGIPWRLLMLPVPLILVDLGLAQIFAKIWPFIAPVMWSWGVFLLVLLGIWAPVKNLKLARKYQDRIDALDSAVRSDRQADL